ncbi:MAG TPA: ATP-dependent helicase, partial [Longimicrobiaceae bacterium]|nr:ATP-dependent helicase [Longimicrobiaceae bacterium]
AARAARQTLYETMRGAQAAPVREFVELMEALRAEHRAVHAALQAGDTGRTLHGWVRELVKRVRLEEAVRAEHARASERAAEVRVDVLREFVASIGAYEERAWGARPLPDEEEAWEPPSLAGFLERVSLVQEDDDRRDTAEEEEPDRVTLLTMHSAKGLEFAHVFIVGVEEEILPHARSVEAAGGGADAVAEERRLFYVALTRARHRLTLSGCATRRRGGDVLPRQPSRFLKEVPPEVVEHRSGRRSSLSAEDSQAMKEDFFARMRELLAG